MARSVQRRRLDAELVRRGLARSRADAVAAVRDGRVTVGGAPAATPARLVGADEAVHLAAPDGQFVSRGGHKLAGALDAFGLDVAGRRVLDAGASTGGFTDCVLQRGAAMVIAVDVGHGQLAWSLRTDERVVVMERTNVRGLDAAAIGGPVDLVVADLSFISLRTVAPALLACATPTADFVLLVKPQFEAGRSRVGKGGVVRDAAIRRVVVGEVIDDLAVSGLGTIAVSVSALTGADGNVEYLAHGRAGAPTLGIDALDRACAPPPGGPVGQNGGS